MAIVSALIGGMIGFVSFLMAYFLFDASFLMSLAIYSGTGLAVAILIMAGGFLVRAVSHNSTSTDQDVADPEVVAGSPAQH